MGNTQRTGHTQRSPTLPLSCYKTPDPNSSYPHHPLKYQSLNSRPQPVPTTCEHHTTYATPKSSVGLQLASDHTAHLPPDWPPSFEGCSPGLFWRKISQTCSGGSASSFKRGLSTTGVSFSYHLRGKRICFDLEDCVLFLSLTGTPPLWTLVSRASAGRLLPSVVLSNLALGSVGL